MKAAATAEWPGVSGIIESGAKLIVLPSLTMLRCRIMTENAAGSACGYGGASVGAMTPEELSDFIARVIT